MKCPYCEKNCPDDAKVCVWCGRSLVETAPPKKHTSRIIAIIAIAAAVAVVIATLGVILRKRCEEQALVGTWQIEVPVGKLTEQLTRDADIEMTVLSSLITRAVANDVTVTVYCRFYENNTYAVYAGYDEVEAALRKATDGVISYACEEGFPVLLEKQGIDAEQLSFVMGLLKISEEDLGRIIRTKAHEWMQPLYADLKTVLVPPDDQTGEYVYELDDDRVYLALEKGKTVEESVYVVWRYDGEHLRFVTGTDIDRYMTGLVWQKAG